MTEPTLPAEYVALSNSGIAHMKDGQKAKGERLIRAAFEQVAKLVADLEAEVWVQRKALSLARSMILCGEDMTPLAQGIIDGALRGSSGEDLGDGTVAQASGHGDGAK